MGCNCGGAKATSDQAVSIDGVEVYRGASVADARMWIAKNAAGKRATLKAVPKET
jgi:hypothetical protein